MMGLDNIRAIGLGSSTMPAAQGFDENVVFAIVRVHAAENGVADHRFAAGRHPLGQALRERLEEEVAKAQRNLPTASDPGGRARIDRRTLGRRDLYQSEEAIIDGYVAINQAARYEGAGGECLRQRRVYRRG